jgi:hypothetical protein
MTFDFVNDKAYIASGQFLNNLVVFNTSINKIERYKTLEYIYPTSIEMNTFSGDIYIYSPSFAKDTGYNKVLVVSDIGNRVIHTTKIKDNVLDFMVINELTDKVYLCHENALSCINIHNEIHELNFQGINFLPFDMKLDSLNDKLYISAKISSSDKRNIKLFKQNKFGLLVFDLNTNSLDKIIVCQGQNISILYK